VNVNFFLGQKDLDGFVRHIEYLPQVIVALETRR